MGNDNIDLWQRVVKSFWEYKEALAVLFSEGVNRVALIRGAVGTNDRIVAVEVARYLKEDEHKQLFDVWVDGASTANSLVHIYRKFILSLPHDWVMERIEAAVEPYLINGSLDEYRRFLELYILLDTDITRKLAERAMSHGDPEVREAGSDFLEILGNEDQINELRKGLVEN
jgi:hypothetical protein